MPYKDRAVQTAHQVAWNLAQREKRAAERTNGIDPDARLAGRDADLVKAAPELFELLTEMVAAYEFGIGMSPELIIRARVALRRAQGA